MSGRARTGQRQGSLAGAGAHGTATGQPVTDPAGLAGRGTSKAGAGRPGTPARQRKATAAAGRRARQAAARQAQRRAGRRRKIGVRAAIAAVAAAAVAGLFALYAPGSSAPGARTL